jgi:hypothetical protein
MRQFATPFKSKEKAHADNCGLHGLQPGVRTFADTLTISGITGNPEVISSPVGLVPTNAPAVTDQSLERSRLGSNRPSMSALAICHQPRIAPDDMGASQYQPSVTPKLSALTIIHVQSDGRSVALIGPENGR